jgi:hypothetical protein
MTEREASIETECQMVRNPKARDHTRLVLGFCALERDGLAET